MSSIMMLDKENRELAAVELQLVGLIVAADPALGRESDFI
jgi:hypothetical protein